MKLHRGLDARGVAPQGCVATIGNFDGVHLGHQALVRRLAERGRELSLPALAITFEPLPVEFFAPGRAPARVTSLAEKAEALGRAGADAVWVLRFNERLADLAPEEFVRRVLVEGADARQVLVGDDFRFGRDRTGDLDLLRRMALAQGFEAAGMESVRYEDARVSSTRVREALAEGDMARAEALLGRSYGICGRVVRGEALGRTLGYPTLNLPVSRRPALQGIFAVEVEGVDDRARPGVASLGTRPTVDGRRLLLETHLLDYDGDLYGRRVRVIFRARLRDEHRFDSLDALTDQMRRDEAAAREILTRR